MGGLGQIECEKTAANQIRALLPPSTVMGCLDGFVASAIHGLLDAQP